MSLSGAGVSTPTTISRLVEALTGRELGKLCGALALSGPGLRSFSSPNRKPHNVKDCRNPHVLRIIRIHLPKPRALRNFGVKLNANDSHLLGQRLKRARTSCLFVPVFCHFPAKIPHGVFELTFHAISGHKLVPIYFQNDSRLARICYHF